MMRVASLAVLLGMSGVACSDDGAADPCGEPTYAGNATDEVWRVILDAYDRAEPGADAPVLTSPLQDQVFPAAGDPPVFSWTSTLASADDAPRMRSLGPRSLLDLVFAIGIGEAHAHLPPITGDVYFLELSLPDAACDVTVLTTNEQYTLDADTWETLKLRAGQPVTLTITSVYVMENRITDDGGPFRASQAITFEVQ